MNSQPSHAADSEERSNQDTGPPDVDALDGSRFARAVRDALALLHRHAASLNAINVFPVPDGDTGTNMDLTLRTGMEAMDDQPDRNVGAAARALARGTLMGARGNSGVILSQILRGIADGLNGKAAADGDTFAAALAEASAAAYGALTDPAEGTILTVAREAAKASSADGGLSVSEALARASAAGRAAVDKTPELLPVLKEAGVVDAGGLGLAIILEGLRRSLAGEPLDVDLAPDQAQDEHWREEAAALHREEHGESGYCTEFVVLGVAEPAEDVRARLQEYGSSLLVVGAEGMLRVHLHTLRPDDAIAVGRSLGRLSQVKVDNMEAQIDRFASSEPVPPITTAIDVVAVAAGQGIEDLFRSIGVTYLVRGGQTMNASAGEIVEAVEACRADDVIVLPNNKNIIAAAEQAAGEASKRARVVPTRSIPEGIAAVLALSPDLTLDETATAMDAAIGAVRSAEITRAVRGVTLDGRRIERGQVIGVVDGTLHVVENEIGAAVTACVEQMLAPDDALLTLYYGKDVRDEDAQRLQEDLHDRFPQLETELVWGGQPNYPYLLSLE